jgi:hypothetical protein
MKKRSEKVQEHRVAEGKKHPIARTVKPAIQQNAEAQPKASSARRAGAK